MEQKMENFSISPKRIKIYDIIPNLQSNLHFTIGGMFVWVLLKIYGQRETSLKPASFI